MATRVVKVGGSLLDLPDLPIRLRAWMAAQPPALNLLIVGGGRFAEAVRHYDRAVSLGNEQAHRLAIRAMSLSTALVAGWLPEARVVNRLDALTDSDLPKILDVAALMDHPAGARALEELPASWEVTSDSIAAQVASVLACNELVLLKSILPTRRIHVEEAADLGIVDRHFSTIAARLPKVRVVNLRDDRFSEQGLCNRATGRSRA